MKVLMFGWEFPPEINGGLGTACHGLTKGLSKKGVEVKFVLPRKMRVEADFLKFVFGDTKQTGYIVNSPISAYLTHQDYKQVLQEGKGENKSFYGKNLIAEVERYGQVAGEIALREDFDVIHAHDWLTYKAGLAAKEASGKPLVVHVHATEFDRTGGNGKNEYVYELEREGMHKADKIITVSNFTKQKVIENYGVPEEKISVVHNGVEFENYSLEKAHDLSKNNKIVLFLGRITLQKGPDYFVNAAKKVLEKMPNTIFVVAGSGDMEKFMIERAAELGISDKLLFAGFVRGGDVHKAYQMSDLYVMPSVSEPFGITPLESIMNGTPAIISKQSGVSEVINHCFKVDFWDVDELANKIIAVLKYPELHQCLAQNGLAEVKNVHWDKSADKTAKVYNEMLAIKN